MKILITFILTSFLSVQLCQAQNDSSIIYISKAGKETTKDSAYMYEMVSKCDNIWHGKTYFVKTKSLQSEGDYADIKCSTPLGIFNNYNEDGTLFSTASYDNGKPQEVTFYYSNGNKKAYIKYAADKIGEQKGWNENGKEIIGYIVQREARFKGGEAGWIKYLQKNLNGNVPVDAGAPAGEYTVEVEFMVSKEGSISNVKATSIPAKCKPCAAKATGYFSGGR